MTDDRVPTTENGKALLRLLDDIQVTHPLGMAHDIRAIEAEAVAADRARIIRTLSRESDGNIYLDIAYVFYIIGGGE